MLSPQKFTVPVKLFYEQGYNTFLTGGSEGFDLVAANAVLQLKRVNTDIQLVMVAPFIGQEQRYSAVDQNELQIYLGTSRCNGSTCRSIHR